MQYEKSSLSVFVKDEQFQRGYTMLLMGFEYFIDLPAFPTWARFVTKFEGCSELWPVKANCIIRMAEKVPVIKIRHGRKEHYFAAVSEVAAIKDKGKSYYRLYLSYFDEKKLKEITNG